MIKKLLVKLTPYDRFFFGGKNTFGEGGSANYFVKSKYFPQQTTLLGLVRYQLMVQNSKGVFKNNKIENKDEAAKLISRKSFEITDNEFDFGKIKEFSPVFIAGENEEYLFPANKEYQWVEENNKFVMREFNKQAGSSSIYSTSLKHFIPYLEGYVAKDGLPDLLINADKKLCKYDDIFIEHKQIGIRKDYYGKTEEKAFYIQFFYKLKKGCSFAFILELEDGINFSSNELVNIGGEQSKFKMDVSRMPDEFDKLLPCYEPSKNSGKVVLVSNAYVSNKIFEDCDFAATDIIDFNSIVTTQNTTKFSSMSQTGKEANGDNNDKLRKSGQYIFFKRGSVFYADDASKLIAHIGKTEKKEYTPLQKIGYNHFRIVNQKET